MSTDRSRATYPVALLVPLDQSHPDYVVDTSGITEADPILTEVVDQGTSALVLEALGTAESTTHIETRCIRGGAPGVGPGAAGESWRHVESPELEYQGKDVYCAISDWEPVIWTQGTGILDADVDWTLYPDAVTLSDGTIVTASDLTTIGNVDGGPYHVAIKRWVPGSGWQAHQLIHTTSTAPVWGFHPTLTVDADDVITCLHWIEDPDAEEAQVRMHYSKDGGATWTTGGRYVLPTAIDISAAATGYQLGKLTAGVYDGDMSLFAELTTNDTGTFVATYAQYASSSYGASFDLVELYDPTPVGANVYGRFEVVVLAGIFYVFHAGGGIGEDEGLYLHILSTPWEAFTVAREVTIDANNVAGTYSGSTGYIGGASDITAAVDFDGTLYVVYAYCDAGGYHDAIAVSMSQDGGETWSAMGASGETGINNAGVLWSCGSTANRPRHMALAFWRGAGIILSNYSSTAGTWDGALGMIRLGGWTNYTRPGLNLFPAPADRVGFTITGLPFDAPTVMGWTATGAGKTGSHTSDGGWQIDTAVGTLYYHDAPTATVAQGIAWEGEVKVSGTPGTGTTEQGIVLRTADGTDEYQISVRIGVDTIEVYDDNGAPDLLGTITLETGSATVHISAELADGACLVLARATSPLQADRYWTDSVQSSSLVNDTATPGAANFRRWGAISSSASGSTWYQYRGVEGAYLGRSRAAGFTNPDDLFPGPLTSEPYPYADDVWVYATQGPAREGDTHRCQADHTHALRFAFPSILASQARGLRTLDDAADLIIPIQLHASADVPLPASIAVALVFGVGRTPKTAYLEGKTGGGWVTLVSGDTTKGRTGRFDRSGDTVSPDPAIDSPWSYHHAPDDLVGDTCELQDGANPIFLRTVGASDGGLWDPFVTAQAERLRLEDTDGTEPASGSIRVRSRHLVMIAHLTGAAYSDLRVRIPAQDTVEGAFEVLWLDFCEVVIPGLPPSPQWVWTLEPGVAIEEADDRTVTAYELGGTLRTLELPYMELLPTHHVGDAQPDPGYMLATTAAGAAPVASMGDWVRRSQGLLRRLRGPLRPVGMVFDVTKKADTYQTIVEPEQILLGRMTSESRAERVNKHGYRLRGVTIRGEV